MKLNINSIEVQPQLGNNPHSVDGVLVGAGSLQTTFTTLLTNFVQFIGQSEPAPMTGPVDRSVHRMGWMILLFFIHLFTLP